ncbi:efflux RND transporter permease subunit [Cohaesibacter gelatinilyticus]|uniref:Multidrug efflux pump subunit AcrB n=1 Tax=Cohaesibacter gelatinilyticus TaxID=372072 RepID=A0A285PD80_9HYPH|nr:efflux RND transporter permease subunit [Cohaesibacter gelatinilyticus]SNZ19669.1 Multidrug efflux pump subunit AcrB [Cohaesibacter gelatinilyticus]
MHNLTAWFIRNPVAANLLMAFILFLGALTLFGIRIEGFPRIPPENITISTYYDGATAAQVDELITRKIEKALEGLEGVKSLNSQSHNGASSVIVRRAGGQDLQKLLDKVRLRIDGVVDLPDKVKRPVIDASGYDFPALYVNLYGQTDPVTLQSLSKRLKQELLSEPEISRLKIWGLHEQQMRIEIRPEMLLRHNLTIDDVSTRIRAQSLNFKAGKLRTVGGNIYLRTDSKARFSDDFAAIPIIEQASGTLVTLSDIATIHDGFTEGDYLFRFNGAPTSGMEILVGAKENLLTISDVVHKVVDKFETQLPTNVKVVVWGDSSSYIADRLELLADNGLQGLMLVGIILALFLNVKLAFWVAMGIPVSVLGAMAVAGSKWVDYSLNDITTFGLIIALGILVDDAVVVGESVYEERRKNKHPVLGTEAGVKRVAVATVFGVLTTIAAFSPMLMLDNPLGKVLASFSGIVIFALIFSLIESKFILPAHLAALDLDKQSRFPPAVLWRKIQAIAQDGLAWVRDRLYQPVLGLAIRQRYAFLILFIAFGSLGLGLIYHGKIKTTFLPEVPGQIISIAMEMDKRAPFNLTRKNLDQIEAIGNALNKELQQQHDLAEPPIRVAFAIIESAQSAMMFAELLPVAQRPNLPILDIVREWRERTGTLEGAISLQFSGAEEMAGGFQLKLQSRDADLLALASKEIRDFLDGIKGVHNIRDNMAPGQPELDIKVRPEARSLGFDSQTLASQIGYAYGGSQVQTIQRGDSEVKVFVLNDAKARNDLDDLMHSQLRNKDGQWVPISAVAEISGRYVSSSIQRSNGMRINSVRASIDKSVASPEEVSQAVFQSFWPKVQAKYPSVELVTGGELSEIVEIKGGLKKALILACVLIYVLMAVPLKSYWQPVVILTIVPFGFISAAFGHLIMNLPLSLLSFFGMLALTGVIVNDCLVMITRYNQAREEGLDVMTCLHEAGVGRFQAIFLTTATTVMGLMPLMSETSEQAQYLIPAAVSLAYGEIFGTMLTLILVPVLLAITEDVKSLFGFDTLRSAPTPEPEPQSHS